MPSVKRAGLEKCSCDEALFYREKMQEIFRICTTHTGEPMVVDLARIANIVDEALELRDFDGEGL